MCDIQLGIRLPILSIVGWTIFLEILFFDKGKPRIDATSFELCSRICMGKMWYSESLSLGWWTRQKHPNYASKRYLVELGHAWLLVYHHHIAMQVKGHLVRLDVREFQTHEPFSTLNARCQPPRWIGMGITGLSGAPLAESWKAF
jgi:hypothetical protein